MHKLWETNKSIRKKNRILQSNQRPCERFGAIDLIIIRIRGKNQTKK